MKPLNPIMAALLAASPAVMTLLGTAHADAVADPASTQIATPALDCYSKIRDEKTPLAAMACLLFTKAEVRNAFADRLVQWYQAPKNGKYFTKEALRAPAAAAELTALMASLHSWPEANKDKPLKLAYLYFVLGPNAGELSSYTQGTVLESTFKAGRPMTTRLENALLAVGWGGKTGNPPTPDLRMGRLAAGADPANAFSAFLESGYKADGTIDPHMKVGAVVAAKNALENPTTRDQLRRDIDRSAVRTDVPGAPRTAPEDNSGPARLDQEYARYVSDMNSKDPARIPVDRSVWELYVHGARVIDVGPPGSYRTLSFMIIPGKDDKGRPIEQIGVLDITTGDTRTARDGRTPSVMRILRNADSLLTTDRSGETGDMSFFQDSGYTYKAVVGPNGSISVVRTDDKGKKSEPATIAGGELRDSMNTAIMESGVAMVDGVPKYIFPRGGKNSTLCVFDVAAMRQNPRARNDAEAVIVTDEVLSDGSTHRVNGKPDAGTIGGKAKHLEWDASKNGWVFVDGAGDPPTPPPAAAPAPGAPATGPANGPAAGGDTTLDQVVARVPPNWRLAPGNAGFSPDVKAVVRIMTSTDQNQKTTYNVLFDPKLGVNGNTWAWPAQIGDGFPLVGLSGFKNYFVARYGKSSASTDVPGQWKFIVYSDYNGVVSMAKNGGNMSIKYMASPSDAGISADPKYLVDDVDVAVDMLVNYMGLDGSNVPELRSCVDRAARGSGYTLSGTATLLKLLPNGTGKRTSSILPRCAVDDGPAADGATSDGATPGTKFDRPMAGGARPTGQDPTYRLVPSVSVINGTDDNTVVLGVKDPSGGNGKRYAIRLYYANGAEKLATPFIDIFGEGGADRDLFKYPGLVPPNGLSLKALPAGVAIEPTAGISVAGNSSSARGVYCALNFLAGTNKQTRKALGAVAWWGAGVSAASADALCKGESMAFPGQ